MHTKAHRALSLPSSVLEQAETLARAERRSVHALVSTALAEYVKAKAARLNGTTRSATRAKPGRRPPCSTRTPLELFNQLQQDLRDIPRSAWKKLPRNGSLHVDKYVYGKP